MKEINLEEILAKIFEPTSQDCSTIKQDLQLAIILNPDLNRILEAMKQACDQVLDLAAENVNDINIDNIVFAETPEIALEGKNKLRTLILETKNWIK